VTVISGDPERLRDYTATTTPAVAAARAPLDAYAAAVRAFNTAENDLGTTLTDNTPRVTAILDDADDLDRGPAAFAFALENLDRIGGGWWGTTRVTDLERFRALVIARLDAPYAADDDVLVAADGLLDTSVHWLWEDDGWLSDRLGSELWWGGNVLGVATGTFTQVDEHLVHGVSGHLRSGRWIDSYHRWAPGTASTMNRVMSADDWALWSQRAGRVGAVAGFALAGAGQAIEDWDDPDLTTGDRIARTGATTLLEGGGGALGGLAGAKMGAAGGAAIGTAIFPGVGTAVGAAVGGIAGGIVGGGIGGEIGGFVNDNVAGLVEGAGDLIDDGIAFGDDVIDGALDLGGRALDTGGDLLDGALDVGGSVVDGALDLGGGMADGALDLGGGIVDGIGSLF
jgi:hypothetical protein